MVTTETRTTIVARTRPSAGLLAAALSTLLLAGSTGCKSLPSAGARPDSDVPLQALAQGAEGRRAAIIELRRNLHRHPELSGQERRTAAVLTAELRSLGLEVRTGVGGHGVVAVLKGAHPGPVVGYRADMDAIAAQEPPGRPHGSVVPGAFHGCGHDLHAAVAVGIAGVLAPLRDRLPGTVVFLLQPAEETLEGARRMIEAGALGHPRPEVFYALHTGPMPVGYIGHGTAMAGLDRFSVAITGERATDEIAAGVTSALRALGTVNRPTSVAEIERNMRDPSGPYASFVYMQALSTKREPGSLRIRGSLRAARDSMYPELRRAVDKAVGDVVQDAAAYRVTFDPDDPFPGMFSDPAVSAAAVPILRRVLGADRVLDVRTTWPFNGEDFALFLKEAPGAMFMIGVANPSRGISGAPHSPDFDLDEEALVVGTKAMSAVIWQRLAAPRTTGN